MGDTPELLEVGSDNKYDPGTENLQVRLQNAFKFAKNIHELSKVPSISIGILHQGEIVFENSVGFRDNQDGVTVPADTGSLYTLSAVSRTFVSTAFGILVHKKQIQWEDKVSKYLPEFNPNDSRSENEATFIDLFRHTSGLDNPVVSILGQGGKVLVSREEFISVLNSTPTKRHGQPLFQTWCQSSVGYGLIVLVIEKLSGKSFSQFLQDEVLDPLGMKHTAVSKSQLEDSNIAHPHAQMEDGSWKKLTHEWTDEENGPILGMFGIRSCIKDMLKYVNAIMGSYNTALKNEGPESIDAGQSNFEGSWGSRNPIQQTEQILNGYYWIRPHDDPCKKEARYHLGWMGVSMPSCMVSWGSGNRTLADCSGPMDKDIRDQGILGRDSGDRLLFKSTGIGFCGTSSVNMFPETNSAVIVLSSGFNHCDAADFVASAFIQELFNLRPRVDLFPLINHECANTLREFEIMLQDLEDNKLTTESEPSHSDDYYGDYKGLGITISIKQALDGKGMEVVFNNRDDTLLPLEHYGKDKYRFGPKSRDEWLANACLDWDYYEVYILTFVRSEGGRREVIGPRWVWEKGAEPYLFK